mgnify:CR=1 FL=1
MQIIYGIDNVRGSVWCQEVLTPLQKEEIAKAIDEEVYERCYGCKKEGHFVNDCPVSALVSNANGIVDCIELRKTVQIKLY